jgi:hypothetical protein
MHANGSATRLRNEERSFLGPILDNVANDDQSAFFAQPAGRRCTYAATTPCYYSHFAH